MIKKDKKTIIFSGFFVLFLIMLDQLTKYLAVVFLKGNPPIPIIKNVFELQYLENSSAAFGIDPISLLQNIFHFEIFEKNPVLYLNIRMLFFYIITILMVLVFVWIFLKIPKNKRMIYLDCVLIFITAGAIGNLIDRIMQQYVVDFLYLKFIDFPIFNVADIYVSCSAVVLLVLGIIYYKDEDIELIFPSKREKKDNQN